MSLWIVDMKNLGSWWALCALVGIGAARAASPVENTRTALEEWVGVERARSEERAAWRQEKSILEDQLRLLDREAVRLQAQADELLAAMDQSETGERESLREQEVRWLEETQILRDRLPGLAAGLQSLEPLLPVALNTELAPLWARLVSPTAADADRLDAAAGCLRLLFDFQSRFTVARQPHPLPDAPPAQVSILYAGLGAAWYVGPDDAGFGTPTPDGWHWTSRPEARAAIQRALDLQHLPVVRHPWVDLPVELQMETRVD